MRTPRLEIEYCTQCRWMLRAAWMAQELLSTFEQELSEVASYRAGWYGNFHTSRRPAVFNERSRENALEAQIDELRKGRSRVIEDGFTLILGWSSKVYSIIGELLIANENQKDPCIVILAERDKIEAGKMKIDFGSQIRNYVLHPYKLVKDARNNGTWDGTSGTAGGGTPPHSRLPTSRS